MSKERFLRCPLCGGPHSAGTAICPVVGKPIDLPNAPKRDGRDGAAARGSSPSVAGGGVPPSRRGHSELVTTALDVENPALPTEPPRALDASALVGALVNGQYLVTSVLGRGGMGLVYEAEQQPIGRRVALKVLHLHEAKNSVTLKRFFQEARIAAALPHSHICQVYDYGQLPDESPFIVMERLEGESLADRLRWEGPMRPRLAIEIACQVLGGLAFAHKRHVVHRDIKPDNVFLAKMGRNTVAKIVDFGLSKVMPGAAMAEDPKQDQLTRAGITMGTPQYMSPEQAVGDRTVDARADLWAVGVTLYECIAGERPFQAKNGYDLMRAIVTEKPKPLGDLRSPLPDGLESVVKHALAKSRDQRYASAGAFQRDLYAILDTLVAARAKKV